MKKLLPIALMAMMAMPLLADPKDDVAAAATKLAGVGNYSWKATMDLGPNSQFTPGPTEGKVDKDGTTWLSVTFNDNTSIGVKMGDKVAIKGEDGWQSGSELTANAGGGGGGGRNPGRMMARRMENLKAPAAEVQDLLTKSKEISKDGEAFTASLTEEGAKALATMGRGRRGGNPPNVSDTKGSVKFWVKDGVLSKYETKVSGKRANRDGDMQEFERTTTVEISNVGSTKLNLPEDAKKKLS
ncbi:MAG TPA: hypothetical protein VGO67_22765 [Verrucomicrobiae bacterium]|jgi:hypothetical protein